MFKAYAPFLIQFSPDARIMLGCSTPVAAQAAFRAITATQAGFDLAVTIADRDFSASSRVMASGTIVIEVDVAPAGLAPRVITGAAFRSATRAARTAGGRTAQ
jgi:hypothetical protein